MDCSLPGSSVYRILQARILVWVAVPFSRGSSQHRDQTQVSCIAGRFFTIWATSEVWFWQDLYIFLPFSSYQIITLLRTQHISIQESNVFKSILLLLWRVLRYSIKLQQQNWPQNVKSWRDLRKLVQPLISQIRKLTFSLSHHHLP